MKKKRLFTALAATVILASGPAFADSHEAACALTYETFEFSVPHTDMEECPPSMEVKADDSFCRLSIVAEVATVFAFSYDTGCIVKTKSYEEDAFKIVLQ